MKNEHITLDIYSKEDFYRKILLPIGFRAGTKRLLRNHGIKTVNDMLTCDNFDGVHESIVARILCELDKYGYRRQDYNKGASECPIMQKAIENMIRLEIPMEYIQGFRYGATYLIEGRTANKIEPRTYPKLFDFVESVKKQSKETIVYCVFNEPSMFGEKTDKYLLLCLDESAAKSPLYQINKQGQICTTVAYGWCESTGIAEPTHACFQISDGGVWCLPYPMAKRLAPKAKQEIPQKTPQEQRREFDDVLTKAIEELNLSVHEINALVRLGLYTVQDLIDYTNGDITECCRNLDSKHRKEVAQKLLAHLEVELKSEN